MMSKAANIDQYLKDVPASQKDALQKLRKIIRTAAPKAEECISYGMPAYRLNGMLVYFAAGKNHCAFYPGSGSILKSFTEEIEGLDTSKGTIRFQPDKPLPASLVRKIVKARMAENAARATAKTKTKAKKKTRG